MAPDNPSDMGTTPSPNDHSQEQQSAPEQPRVLPRADTYPFRIIDSAPVSSAPAIAPISPPTAPAVPSPAHQPKRRGIFLLALLGSLVLFGLLLLLLLRALAPAASTTPTGAKPPTAQGTMPGSGITGTATPGTPPAQGTPGTQTPSTPGAQPTGTAVGVGIQPTNTPGISPTTTAGPQPTATPTPKPTSPPPTPARLYVSPNPASMSCLAGGTTYLSVDNDGGQRLHWMATTDSANVTITPSGAVAPYTSETATLHVTILQLSSFHALFQANGSVKMVSVLVTCS